MKAYKGFNHDMTCRGFKYETGKTYETDAAVMCKKGFHACKSPLDVFGYYVPSASRFCEVDLDGDIQTDGDKSVASKITIGAEIGIPGLVKAHIEYTQAQCREKVEVGEAEAATAGSFGAATAGYRGAATAGYRGAATAGDSGAATSRGSVSVGADGIACARGNGCRARGGLGAVLVIAEEEDDSYKNKYRKVFTIDGVLYKPNVWYKLDSHGNVTEAEESGVHIE